MKTANDLTALLAQRTWDKEVVLWIGAGKELMDTIGAIPHGILDLLDLFNEDNLPIDEDETRNVLRLALRNALKSLRVGGDRLILVVQSAGLLAKYNLGLREFFDWFCGDHWMVILALDGPLENLKETLSLPDEIICDADRLVDYFQSPGLIKQIYSQRK
jgi:hypothetical protein